MPEPPPVLAIVLKGYPRLSETFIAQEIRALEERGHRIRLYSLRHPTDPAAHPIHARITAPVTYLPEYLRHAPLRVLRAAWRLRRRPALRRALAVWLKDLRRDATANRIRRFGQALVLAAEIEPRATWIYAHFLHTPASVARYAAIIARLPWSVSAHAKDVWTIPEWEKREKLAACAWAVTCTEINARHLRSLAPAADTVTRLYHGLDFARFPAPNREPSQNDGTEPRAPVVVLSVGRLVEKKGYDRLLAALALLPDHLAWRLVHIGGGPLASELAGQAARLGLAARIEWRGAKSQTDVLAAYRAADLFVLPSRIAADGDRDGLPNVLMEAQSQGIACVASDLSAIPELIRDGKTGLLVPPDDAPALARAIERLIRSPKMRARLGSAGLKRVRAHFSFESGVDWLSHRLRLDQPLPPECASFSMRL